MYALEIKNRIISQYQDGASINELASKNHIAPSTLYSWVNTAMKSTQRKAGLTARDVYAMKCNEKKMRQYNEIYSSTGVTVQSPLRDRLSAIDNLIERYSLNILTDALNVRKSTYYSHRKILESITNHDLSDEYLKQVIEEEFTKAKGRFGSKKIHVKLAQRGIVVGVNRIARLMKELGLSCVSQKPSRWTSPSYQRYRHNKLDRNFDQTEPNKVWVSDFTYIKMKDEKFFYVCAIMDLFSRRIIAYHLSESIDTAALIYTFDEAFSSRSYPSGLMFHSDQGTQYISYQFVSYLRELGVVQSLSKPGCPYDNSVMESFFATLKKEALFREKYSTLNDLKTIIDEYILFYNSDRPHYKLKMKTPDEVEKEYFEDHNH